MSVFQQIPPPFSTIVDPGTGQVTGLWYNYLVNFGGAVSGFLIATNNLSDVGNPTTARSNLGALGTSGAVSVTTLGTIITGTWNATAIGVPYGGTGLTSYTQGDLLYASAGTTISKLAKDTNATRYLSNQGASNNPSWNQVNLANGVTGDLPFANLTQGSGLSVLGVTGGSTADVASIAGTANQVLRVDSAGTGLSFGATNLASSSAVTGTLPVANGGIGTASNTAYAVLCGGTTSTAAVQSIASVGTSGHILTSNGAGALPTFQAPAAGGTVDLTTGVTGVLPVPNGGTGLSSTTAYAVLCGGTSGTSALQSVASVGTSGQVLMSNGASNKPSFQAIPVQGKPIVQEVYTITGTSATGSTTLPADNTIPQSGEGIQVMTQAITPTNASNLLVVNVIVFGASSVNNTMTCALFQDSTANALAAVGQSNTADFANCFKLEYVMVAGTTSATTFKVRLGGTAAGTTTFCGRVGTQLYGGVGSCIIRISEITV